MRTYRLTNEAIADLDEIWLFVAEDSVNAADRLIETCYERFQSLAQMPLAARARPEIAPQFRSSPIGNDVVLFRPTDTGVEIVRVVHGARDIGALFGR